MRYYLIGNKDSKKYEYDYAEHWLKLNGNSVINPSKICMEGIEEKELNQIKLHLLSFCDSVLVLDNSCDTYELAYAKSIGKKIKYLSKQWRLKRKEINEMYYREAINV